MSNTPSIFIITESSFAVCIDIMFSFLEVCCRFQRESLRQVQQDPCRAGRRWASDDADNRRRRGIRDRVAVGREGRHGGSDQRDRHPQSRQQIPPPRDKWSEIPTGKVLVPGIMTVCYLAHPSAAKIWPVYFQQQITAENLWLVFHHSNFFSITFFFWYHFPLVMILNFLIIVTLWI